MCHVPCTTLRRSFQIYVMLWMTPLHHGMCHLGIASGLGMNKKVLRSCLQEDKTVFQYTQKVLAEQVCIVSLTSPKFMHSCTTYFFHLIMYFREYIQVHKFRIFLNLVSKLVVLICPVGASLGCMYLIALYILGMNEIK